VDDMRTPDSNLSSALRLHVLAWLKEGFHSKNT
jgi:predicted DNA-binding ribbon-helix-helix protein